MEENNKNRIKQIGIGIASTLFFVSFVYYLLFHSFVHDWIVKIWDMINML